MCRRRVANRSRLLAVAQEKNDIDNISSSENEEFPDTIVTRSIPSVQRGGRSSKVKAEDESNTSQIISNPSSNHPINISVFLGDVSTDKQVKGDESISQESRCVCVYLHMCKHAVCMVYMHMYVQTCIPYVKYT